MRPNPKAVTWQGNGHKVRGAVFGLLVSIDEGGRPA